ncbi:TPR repeat-contatining protein [Paramagnetospirillum magnetotacticum MS-1]|uniref:TPR repeat-contatining protein n=1 Tax=Paramagnetospirillum magnetotacticum MS-1 TaxID=272627 RepID=A0A0C2YNZ1_PARME|nr:tetratricopeptide repeat-containing glycosyltransferase family protein [Paramagnetospirillum magnetotacticum]KIL96823.1 TPR repeat-contatining protein [Paramagnetospirillum magnetotacticum MS-1]
MTASQFAPQAQQAFAAAAQAYRDGRMDDAAQGFATAALLEPGWNSAHANLGAVLRRQGKAEAAVACYRRALSLGPEDAGTLSNMGNALRDLGQLEEGEKAHRRAVALAPDSINYRYNLALLLRDRRLHAEARAMLAELAATEPDNAEIQWDLALADLYLGDYQRGFAGYEWRTKLARNPVRDHKGPRWSGDDPVGRTILLLSEQGFGDALQFARYVPLLAARGAKVVLECLPEQAELFAGLDGVVALVTKGSPPPAHDCWAPLASLPHLLDTRFDAIPAQVPYLSAPPRPNLRLVPPPGQKLAIGLVWAGKTTPRDRSWPLEELVPLLADPRATFYSLQLGPRAGDLRLTGLDRLVRDAAPVLKSFADTAHVMESLDLIITIDTSVAHLAGALGRPVWVLLRYVSDWRWQDEPLTSPWYPTMRLFRQPTPMDFKTPVAEMAAALASLIDAPFPDAPITDERH